MRTFKLEFHEHEEYKFMVFRLPDECIVSQVLKAASQARDQIIPGATGVLLIESDEELKDIEKGFRAQYIGRMGKRWNVVDYGTIPYFLRKIERKSEKRKRGK